MKTNGWFLVAGVLLAAGLTLSMAGCRRDPALPEVPDTVDAEAPDTADVVDAVENQQYCPVMPNMEVDRSIYVDHEGERVYFCCAGCVAAFEAEPEKYMAQLRQLHEDPEGAVEDAEDAVDHGHDHDHDHGHH